MLKSWTESSKPTSFGFGQAIAPCNLKQKSLGSALKVGISQVFDEGSYENLFRRLSGLSYIYTQ